MAHKQTSAVPEDIQPDPHEARRPGAEHQRLDAFVGHWRLEGENAPAAPAGASTKVQGEESYEWLPGGFFVTSRWLHRFGSDRHEGIGVIGYDPTSRSYTSNSFDNLGYHRSYRLTVRNGVWHYSGQFERARLEFDGGGDAFTIAWEMSKDSRVWQLLCELHGSRLHG